MEPVIRLAVPGWRCARLDPLGESSPARSCGEAASDRLGCGRVAALAAEGAEAKREKLRPRGPRPRQMHAVT